MAIVFPRALLARESFAQELLGVFCAILVLLVTALVKMSRKGSSSTATPATAAKKKVAKADDFPNGPLVILWGSQTGTAEGFGKTLAREARQRGFKARSIDLEDYEPDELAEEEAPVVFLMATHGEGDPSDNAVQWYKHLNNEAVRQPGELKGVRCATFALGNRQYEHYCYMGRWMDAKLAALGATRLCALGEGDDDDNLEGDFDKWRAVLWEALCPGGGEITCAPTPQFECKMLPGGTPPATAAFLGATMPKQRLHECRVRVNRELTLQPEHGSVRHLEIETGGGGNGSAALQYATADDLAVCCDNGAELAARVAARLSLKPEQRFALRRVPGSALGGGAPPMPTPCSVEQALRYHADLRAPVGKALLLLLAKHAKVTVDAAHLRHLASSAGRDEFEAWVQRDGRGLADLLEAFPSAHAPWAALLELVPKLSPRYYTISSSPAAATDTVHLTVKVLREPMRGGAAGRTKVGVCSTHLGDLAPGDSALVFVRPSGFALPKDHAAPVIMVGPGTGVAPFRAFLQQMAAETGLPRTGPTWLYFGCRREEEDYLYREELETYLGAGTLARLRLAFSRAQAAKVYVQHLVRDDGAELWAMLQRGGHVYICGGTLMGRDVVEALTGAVARHGALGPEGAAKYLKEMEAGGRLVKELWS